MKKSLKVAISILTAVALVVGGVVVSSNTTSEARVSIDPPLPM